jgi:hypothetical protein
MKRRGFLARVSSWFTPTHQEAPVAEAVLTRHANALMRMKGVLSVGVGRTEDGRPAIFVGIDDPKAPSVADIPESIEGVPVVHRRIGRPQAQAPTVRPDIARAERSARAVARRRIPETFTGVLDETPVEEPPDDDLDGPIGEWPEP